MDIQKNKNRQCTSDFQIGDLVKCTRYSEGSCPQTWNRTTHLGVIVAKRTNSEYENYTVWSEGETFECADVLHLTSDDEVFDGKAS